MRVAVADSAVELARLVGATKNTVLSSISHGTGTYEKVELEQLIKNSQQQGEVLI